jgi:predicted NACHT family NTPase
LPIYVEMKAYDGWDDTLDQPGNLLEFLKKSLTTHPSREDDPEHHGPMYVADHLSEILAAGRATVIFDALDEMPQQTYRQRTDALKRFVKHWKGIGPDNRFVFSCRQFDYTDPLSTDRFPVNEIVIEPFDESRIKQYLKNNLDDPSSTEAFFESIERKETLREAVSNPFFLNALTEVRNKHNGELPNTRSEVIKAYVVTLLAEIENDKDRSDDFEKIDGGLPALRGFLSELGFMLQLTGTSAHPDSLSELWKRYPQWQEMISLALSGRILREEPDYTARRRNTPSRRIEFKHHRLQEYFAAEALAQRFNKGEVIDQYLKDIWWQEVVLFAIASVNDKHAIIEGMLSVRKQTEEWITQVLAQAKNPFAKPQPAPQETSV